VHGYPITEQYAEVNPINGKTYTVQYFERSRMELHPENAGSPYEMLLGLLGTQLAQKQDYSHSMYPTYGHAVDFSWISGHLGPASKCGTRVYNCDRFFYGPISDTSTSFVQVFGKGWSSFLTRDGRYVNVPIVLFGHFEEIPELECPPGYNVDRWQSNMAQ
jgi:hypothetical protein